MENKYVRCWNIQDSPEYLPDFSKFMFQVKNAGISPYMEFKRSSIEYIFSLSDLERYSYMLPDEGKTTLERILNGEVPQCECCGCYFTSIAPALRRAAFDYERMIIECPRCVGLSSVSFCEIQKLISKYGVEAALKYQSVMHEDPSFSGSDSLFMDARIKLFKCLLKLEEDRAHGKNELFHAEHMFEEFLQFCVKNDIIDSYNENNIGIVIQGLPY